VKLDSDGTMQWKKSLGVSSWDEARSIHQIFDGGYIASGYSGSNDGDVSQNIVNPYFGILKLDEVGAIE
jgi:hypothetical protein